MAMANKPESYVVLAAVAFDDTGERALVEATRYVQLHQGSELHVVNVAVGVSDGKASDEVIKRISDELKARVQAIQAQRPLKVTAHIRTGVAARAILQTAADLDADLVVVGTHKRAGVEKLMLGSVAERVLRDAHCPVLVAMPKDHVRAAAQDVIEAPCPDCVAARKASANANYWCERHSHSYLRPHVYEPSASRRPGPMEM
jgi:nucleotide-binding universal stress UspA family protein